MVMVGLLAIAPAVAWADDTSDQPDDLEYKTHAISGVERLGSTQTNSTPHMQMGLGQNPSPVTWDDIAQDQTAREARAASREAKAAAAAGRAAAESSEKTEAAARAAEQK
jgi:hypothetical protein